MYPFLLCQRLSSQSSSDDTKWFVFPEWGMLESDTSKLEIISMVAARYLINYPDMDLSFMPVVFSHAGYF